MVVSQNIPLLRFFLYSVYAETENDDRESPDIFIEEA